MTQAKIIHPRSPSEHRIIANGNPVILAEGRIGALMQFPVLVDEGDGYVEKIFEKFVRPPGTRIIALQNKKIYLQHEVRLEKNNTTDWRLPGGKVVDSFKEYQKYLNAEIPEKIILEAAAKELHEEAHLKAKDLKIFTKKDCGALVQWDLYYIVATNVESEHKPHQQEGEDIRNFGWFSAQEVLKKCQKGEISEGRTAAVLIEFLAQNNP